MVVFPVEVGRGSGWGWFRIGLLCLLRCIVCLLGLLLCACFRLSLPLLGFFTLLQLAPCFGSCSASRGHHFALGTGGFKQSLLVGGTGPVYSPEILFQTLSQLQCMFQPIHLELKRHCTSYPDLAKFRFTGRGVGVALEQGHAEKAHSKFCPPSHCYSTSVIVSVFQIGPTTKTQAAF